MKVCLIGKKNNVNIYDFRRVYAYAKADFRFAHALNVFQGLIDKAPTVEERKHGHWEDIDLDTSVCSVCKKPQEYETKYCPECGAKMENNGDDDDE